MQLSRALVVDDNLKIVEVLAAYLEQAGLDVTTASDGITVLEAARASRPDIALLDVMMPGMDGFELMRALQREMDIPVILVTAKTEEVDRLVGLELGADDYVTKPFSPREVVARVKAVLRRVSGARSAESRSIAVGELVMDLDRREVRVGDMEAQLTRSEFDILATMAAHPGRVYTRLQLLEAAQGEAFEGYERTVDAHVKNIRKKLGEDPRHPKHVHTVFGVGYKVSA